MPIIVKGTQTRAQTLQDFNELKAKREARAAKKAKYHLIRKDKTPSDYEGVKLVIDGKEMELSDSSKFLLEQLIKTEEID
jgi:hypothetical protein